jgi:uncharacterized membrane protein
MHEGSTVFPVWVIVPVLLIGAVSVLLFLLAPKGERPPDEAYKGVFYSNSDDRALLVPKRFGIGYTLNFGNPWAWVVLALILLVAAAPFVATVVFMSHLRR